MWEDIKCSDVTFANKLFQAVKIDSYKELKKMGKIKPYQQKCLLRWGKRLFFIKQSISHIECQYKLVIKVYVGNENESSWNSKRKAVVTEQTMQVPRYSQMRFTQPTEATNQSTSSISW